MNSTDYERSKKMVGLKIIAILSIILYGLIILTSFSYVDVGLFFLYLVFFGGLIVLASIGLVGLNRRRSYAIGVNRAVLIFFSFWTGILPTGLILLLIFWPRLKDTDVLIYLNYPGFADNKIMANYYKDPIIKSKETQFIDNSPKYCIYCGEQIHLEAQFCKKCGKRIY